MSSRAPAACPRYLLARALAFAIVLCVARSTCAFAQGAAPNQGQPTAPVEPSISSPRRPGAITAWLPVVASGVDLGSTISLVRGGGREQNPVLGSSVTRIVVTKAALTGVIVLALHKASPHHPRAAKWIAIGATSAFGLAAIKNLR